MLIDGQGIGMGLSAYAIGSFYGAYDIHIFIHILRCICYMLRYTPNDYAMVFQPLQIMKATSTWETPETGHLAYRIRYSADMLCWIFLYILLCHFPPPRTTTEMT